MKKLLLLFTLASFAAAMTAHAAASRSDYVKRVETCEAILQEFMSDPSTAIPANVLRRARGLIIVNQLRAGFFIGIKDGYAVMMVRRPDNSWSIPVLLSAGEGSVGLQVGVTRVETIYVLTNDETARQLFKERFNVGVDAKAVAGPRVAQREHYNRAILNTPVLVYSKNLGLFVGATVKAGYVARNDEANRILYHTTYTLPELLYGDWVEPVPEVRPLMNYVRRIAP